MARSEKSLLGVELDVHVEAQRAQRARRVCDLCATSSSTNAITNVSRRHCHHAGLNNYGRTRNASGRDLAYECVTGCPGCDGHAHPIEGFIHVEGQKTGIPYGPRDDLLPHH